MDALEARLTRLERRLARTRLALATCAVALAALLVMGITGGVPDELRIKRLHLINNQGTPVLTLDVGKWGGLMELLTHDGRSLAKFMAVDTGAMLSMRNSQGVLTALLDHTETAEGLNGSFKLLSPEGRALVYAGASRDGDGQLRLLNARGRSLVYAGANQLGNGMLRVNSKEGGQAAVLVNRPEAGGHIEVFTEQGEPAGILRANEHGVGEIQRLAPRR